MLRPVFNGSRLCRVARPILVAAVSFSLLAINACRVPEFGLDDDAVSARIVNNCDAPVDARFLRPDGVPLRGRLVVVVGAHPLLSASVTAFDGVDHYMVEIGLNGSPSWVSDPIPLTSQRPTFIVTGTCVEGALCELVDTQEVQCVAPVDD